MFNGIEHVAIASADPAALAKWYVDTLSFRINYEYDGNYFVKAPNGAILEIIPAKRERVPQEMFDPGLRHMAITVSDFDAAYQSLKDRGVNFVGEPFKVTPGHRLVFFTDCEGNLIHLIRRAFPLPE